MKKMLVVVVFLMVSCLGYEAPAAEITCDNPVGYEYICYNSAECLDYLAGYGGVLRERFLSQKDGWFTKGNKDVQTVHINLFFDHQGFSVIGKTVGTRHNNRVWIVTTTMVCDIMGEILEPLATLDGWASWRIE
jgi:hypothetical protein